MLPLFFPAGLAVPVAAVHVTYYNFYSVHRELNSNYHVDILIPGGIIIMIQVTLFQNSIGFQFSMLANSFLTTIFIFMFFNVLNCSFKYQAVPKKNVWKKKKTPHFTDTQKTTISTRSQKIG